MNITGKFLKVWKVEQKNGFTKINMGDSKKKKDGTYDSWTWFDCTLLGNAKNASIKENDVVEVKSGIISKRKYNEKYYDDIIIFEIEVMQHSAPANTPNNDPDPIPPGWTGNNSGFNDDIPF